MTRRDIALLFFLALAVRLIAAVLIPRPGYMDAAYYAAGAVQLAQGGGLNEPFLWHYLDDPATLPHPGFLYWMPLPSLLAAPFAALFPGSFFALQLPFVLLSALLPLVAYAVAWQATPVLPPRVPPRVLVAGLVAVSVVEGGVRRRAWAAGLLTLFSGFFFPYWTLPETFAPFALFGSLALWLAGKRGVENGEWRMENGEWRMEKGEGRMEKGEGMLDACRWLLVGLLVGLAHLTRADGILLLPVVILPLLVRPRSRTTFHAPRTTHHVSRFTFDVSRFTFDVSRLTFHVSRFTLVILGYLLVVTPWFIRNLGLIGAPLSPAGAKTLWLRTYDDMFCHGCDLSLRSYLTWGWGNILRSKLWALGVNLERFLAEDCLVFLLPFVLIGLYRLRRRSPFALSLIYLFLIYLTHSLAFTFPGPRGGFFHASAPVLPFLFVAGAEGLDAVVGWVGRRRRWNLRQAQVVFTVAMVVAAVAMSGYATVGKLSAWRDADAAYLEIGVWLDEQGVPDSTIVMVGNPPGFWYYTHRPAVVVPNGDANMLLEACARYDIGYLVLDVNRPQPLAGLYRGMRVEGLEPVATFDGGPVRLYEWTGRP